MAYLFKLMHLLIVVQLLWNAYDTAAVIYSAFKSRICHEIQNILTNVRIYWVE